MTTPAGDGLLGATQVRALAARARTTAHQAVGPELRHRRQHRAPDRARCRASARGPGRRGRSGPGLPDPGAAACAGARDRRRDRPPLAGAAPEDRRGRSRRTVPTGSRWCRPTRCAPPNCPDRRPRPWSRTCPTTCRCRWCCPPGMFPSITRVLVMVQREVADRLARRPGAGLRRPQRQGRLVRATCAWPDRVGRNVFWPAPNVDSGLVEMTRRDRAGERRPPRGGLRRARRRVRPAPQDPAGRRSRAGPAARARGAGRSRAAGVRPRPARRGD